jgi:hypothetical protein
VRSVIYRNLHTRWPSTPFFEVGMKCRSSMCLLYEPDFNERYDYSVQRIVMFIGREENGVEAVAREFFKRTALSPVGFDVTHVRIRADVPEWIKGVVAVGEPLDVLDFALGLRNNGVEAVAYTYKAIAPSQSLLYAILKRHGCKNAGELIRDKIAPKIKKFVTRAYKLSRGAWIEGGFDFLRTFGVGSENEVYIDKAGPADVALEAARAFNMVKEVVSSEASGCEWTDELESEVLTAFVVSALGQLLIEFKSVAKEAFVEAMLRFYESVDANDLPVPKVPANDKLLAGIAGIMDAITNIFS